MIARSPLYARDHNYNHVMPRYIDIIYNYTALNF